MCPHSVRVFPFIGTCIGLNSTVSQTTEMSQPRVLNFLVRRVVWTCRRLVESLIFRTVHIGPTLHETISPPHRSGLIEILFATIPSSLPEPNQ